MKKSLLLGCVLGIASLGAHVAQATEGTEAETSEEDTEEVAAEAPALSAGPTQPIGHTLRTPEMQARINQYLAKTKAGTKERLTAAAAPAPGTKPLVGGKYGFAEPSRLEGVPKAFVNLGNLAPTYGIVVEKLYHRLTIFKMNADRTFDAVKTYRAITGRDPGDKVSRGDLRTPEGIYFITGRLEDRQLPPKYGRLALTLDYPNIYDQRRNKSGYGIWIHATDDPKRLARPFDTQGCVAVSNEDVVDIAKYVTPFETPVVITKEMTTTDIKSLEEPRQKALEMIDSWKQAWENSDFDSYMSFYSKNFISLKKNRKQWENYKQMLSRNREGNIRVRMSEPKILAFEDQLLAVFMQDYSSPQHSDFGRKFLYLQWEGDRYRIIAEKWYPAKKTETAVRDFKPM